MLLCASPSPNDNTMLRSGRRSPLNCPERSRGADDEVVAFRLHRHILHCDVYLTWGRSLYSNILVSIDLEEPSSWVKAVPVGLALAKSFGATITLCTVVPDRVAIQDGAQWSRLSYQALLDSAKARLALLAEELRGETPMEVQVGMGSIYGGILDRAEEAGADLIVLASHRPAMRDWLIGANASRVVRHARCSVLVVRE